MEYRQDLVVQRHLIATRRAPVGEIKRQNDGLTPQVAQRDELIRVLFSLKSGAFVWGPSGLAFGSDVGDEVVLTIESFRRFDCNSFSSS